MAQPNSEHIVSPPNHQGQPYSAEDGATDTSPWEEVKAGPCDINTGRLKGGEWPGGEGWVQV